MDYLINGYEIEAMCGLLHFHQLAYLRGIRPYMDVNTGIVGIKRGISHQSIAEQLYIEPHQGIKSENLSRAQIRRAISGLERAGLILIQSEGFQLILKCQLATLGYFTQNKPITNPSHQEVTFKNEQSIEYKGFFGKESDKADIGKTSKAVTPLNRSNNYIFLLKHFEKFWDLYPLKNSEPKTWQIFQELNPSEELITQILTALQNQLQFVQRQQALGKWVPNWKNPANWLAQCCWNDEIPTDQQSQEVKHAQNQHGYRKQQATDPLWDSCQPDSEEREKPSNNVIPFSKWGR
jgi:hypothetical protein